MDLLKARIRNFNEVIDYTFEDDQDYSEFYRIEQGDVAHIEDINELQSFLGETYRHCY